MFTQGKYRARPTIAEYGKTSKDTDQVAITFQLLDGPDAGKHIAYYGYFTDATAEETFEAMRNAGWDGADLRDLSSIGKDPQHEVVLVIRNEPDLEGAMRSRVRYVNRAAGGAALKTKMTDAERDSFARRMQGKLDQYKRKAAQTAAQARPPRPVPKLEEKGDDIPF